MKKICFIVSKLYNGGAERVVSILANAFVNEKYDIAIVCFEKKDNEYYVDEHVKRYTIQSEKGTLGNFIETIRFIKKSDFDIIIGFDIFPNLICSFASIGSKKKFIISERNAPKQVNINPLLKMMRYISYSFVDAIVFQTKEAMYCYRKGIVEKGTIIKNPVSAGLPRRSNIHKKEIVAMGRLTAQKNYKLLIKAAKQIHEEFSDYVFKIYGQGELEKELQNYIDNCSAGEYIILEGYYDNVYQQIVNSDIFIMTSLYEGMPNSLIEAMCMGFPVISSDCPSGGPKELIIHGENGLLFKNNDEKDLVKQLRLVLNDEIKKEKLGKNALKLNNELNEEIIVKKWINLVSRVEGKESDKSY